MDPCWPPRRLSRLEVMRPYVCWLAAAGAFMLAACLGSEQSAVATPHREPRGATTNFLGMLYQVGQAWFGLSEETAHLFMTIHEGGWLGGNLKVYYSYSVTLGSGLLALGFFGLTLLRRRRRPAM